MITIKALSTTFFLLAIFIIAGACLFLAYKLFQFAWDETKRLLKWK